MPPHYSWDGGRELSAKVGDRMNGGKMFDASTVPNEDAVPLADNRWFSAEGMRPKYPMVGSFAGCCARKQGDTGIRLVTGLICINNEISLKVDVAHGVQATCAKSLSPLGFSTYSG